MAKLGTMNEPLLMKNEPPALSSITIEEQERERDAEENILKDEQGDIGLAKSWKMICGENDWEGMLDPMHPLLRSELIRYGEMAQACYDAFDYDDYSKYRGSSKIDPSEFFESESLGLSSHGYHVTTYLYANINLPNFFKTLISPEKWSTNANWIGYIAVSGDETSKRIGRRDITIAWRGTVTQLEWLEDLKNYLKPISAERIPCPDPNVRVQSGFLDLYTDKNESCRFSKYSAREQTLAEVIRLIEKYSNKEKYPNEELSITITGHSLGSALAILSAFDIAENVMVEGSTVQICVFSFSGPRVGNRAFKERLKVLRVKVLRVVNKHDIVPAVPGILVNENLHIFLQKILEWLPWSYSHVGKEFQLDHKISPYLKDTTNPVPSHNLEAHLHLLDGYHGTGKEFVLTSGRDPALVNKGSDFLKDDYYPDPDHPNPVPPFWRQDQNKGWVRNKQGRWVQPERPWIENHPTHIHNHLKKNDLSTEE